MSSVLVTLLGTAVAALLVLTVLYWVIRLAVRDGVKDADRARR